MPKQQLVRTKVTLRVGDAKNFRTLPPREQVTLDEEEAERLCKNDLAIIVRENTDLTCELGEGDLHTQVAVSNCTERVDAIIDVIADLTPEDFGKDKKPGVKAIGKILGEDITASERDQAWTQYQALTEDD